MEGLMKVVWKVFFLCVFFTIASSVQKACVSKSEELVFCVWAHIYGFTDSLKVRYYFCRILIVAFNHLNHQVLNAHV